MSGIETHDVLVPVANTREQRRDASRYVLRRATSVEDLRQLLDALGLNTTTSTEEER